MKPGSDVMRISATDIDDGDNRLIEYALSENATAQFFKVDPNTGILKLDRAIPSDVSYQISALHYIEGLMMGMTSSHLRMRDFFAENTRLRVQIYGSGIR